MPTTPRRRKLYRQTKRLLIRRFLKLNRELATWDGKLVFMPRVLDTPELLLAFSAIQVAFLAKLEALEPLPGEIVP